MSEHGVDESAQPAGGETRREYWPMVNFRIPPEGQEQLEAYAKQRCISVSAVIRIALVDAGILKPRSTES